MTSHWASLSQRNHPLVPALCSRQRHHIQPEWGEESSVRPDPLEFVYCSNSTYNNIVNKREYSLKFQDLSDWDPYLI